MDPVIFNCKLYGVLFEMLLHQI